MQASFHIPPLAAQQAFPLIYLHFLKKSLLLRGTQETF